MGITFRPSSVDWDVIQSILSRYDKSLADFLIEVVEQGGNLGAFKQLWRKWNKKELLPSFDDSAKVPFNNINALEWDLVDAGALDLKLKRQERLNLYR